jgi:hypothetical protein
MERWKMNKKSKPTAIEPKLSKAQVVQLVKANLPLVEIKNLGLKHLSINMTHYYVKPASKL